MKLRNSVYNADMGGVNFVIRGKNKRESVKFIAADAKAKNDPCAEPRPLFLKL